MKMFKNKIKLILSNVYGMDGRLEDQASEEISKLFQVKDIEWEDSTTDLAKGLGYFEIIHYDAYLGLAYKITNTLNFAKNGSGGYYLYGLSDTAIHFKTLDKAKLEAQKHYEEKIINKFFKNEW